jgi:acyl-CoA thioesterase
MVLWVDANGTAESLKTTTFEGSSPSMTTMWAYGGMVYAESLKVSERKLVGVRVPLRLPLTFIPTTVCRS